MSSNTQYDVIVIGGGASGMMAAGRAASRGKKVLLLEKNRELGKKLSITGGGRCNIFNAEEETRVLLSHYGDAAKFLHAPFSQYGMRDSWKFFEAHGLPIVIEARQRAFPASQRAPDVTATLKHYLTSQRVEIKTRTGVRGFTHTDGVITGVITKTDTYHADSYILATGGASYEQTGSTGEGVQWLGDLGHTIYAPNPDIVPLTVQDTWVKNLSGTTLSFMKITFGSDRSKNEGRFSRTGKILFTHFGLSGPLVLNAAHEVKKLLAHGPVPTTIDLYPDTEVGTLRNRILELFAINKNKTFKNILKECVPSGMQEAIATHIDADLLMTKVHSITREEREGVVDLLKALPLTVTGTMGMDWAVISDGGVDLTEIDTRTMRSRLYSNLFCTGDVLHINRPSGGYSLQLCWTTGWVAGTHA